MLFGEHLGKEICIVVLLEFSIVVIDRDVCWISYLTIHEAHYIRQSVFHYLVVLFLDEVSPRYHSVNPL